MAAMLASCTRRPTKKTSWLTKRASGRSRTIAPASLGKFDDSLSDDSVGDSLHPNERRVEESALPGPDGAVDVAVTEIIPATVAQPDGWVDRFQRRAEK
jgi:hypothetical protein